MLSNVDPSLQRIWVVGTSCAGKTTFAAELAKVLRLNHVDLDSLHWGPNWTPSDPVHFRQLVEKAVAEDRWAISGNYTSLQRRLFESRDRRDLAELSLLADRVAGSDTHHPTDPHPRAALRRQSRNVSSELPQSRVCFALGSHKPSQAMRLEPQAI